MGCDKRLTDELGSENANHYQMAVLQEIEKVKEQCFKMLIFTGINVQVAIKHLIKFFGITHICSPFSLGAIALPCVGEVHCTGSAGGSTSQRRTGGGEQRLTDRVGTTRGCVMLTLRRIASAPCSTWNPSDVNTRQCTGESSLRVGEKKGLIV